MPEMQVGRAWVRSQLYPHRFPRNERTHDLGCQAFFTYDFRCSTPQDSQLTLHLLLQLCLFHLHLFHGISLCTFQAIMTTVPRSTMTC